MTETAVSVVVVAHNEESQLGECLASLVQQDYPRELFEILVVDDHSEDTTVAVAESFQEFHPRLRVVSSPSRGIAAARNCGMRESVHSLLAFTDADCVAHPDWLSALVKVMLEERAKGPVAAVGGPNFAPEQTTLFRQAVELATANYWGSHGSVQGQSARTRHCVDHLPGLNVMFELKALYEIGGYDEELGNIGEDVDLSYRLRWRGYSLIYDPRPIVRHRWRETVGEWCKNMELYGRGRVWLIKKDRRHFQLKFLAPLVLLLGLCLSVFGRITFWALIPTHLYLTLTLLASLHAAGTQRRWSMVPLIILAYTTTHIFYGLGQLRGLFTRPPRWSP